MLATIIPILAMLCAFCVALICLLRWRATKGFAAWVYLAVAALAGLAALLNLSGLLASDASFVRTATFAYIGFATAALLPAARALGELTYDAPEERESDDAAV